MMQTKLMKPHFMSGASKPFAYIEAVNIAITTRSSINVNSDCPVFFFIALLLLFSVVSYFSCLRPPAGTSFPGIFTIS